MRVWCAVPSWRRCTSTRWRRKPARRKVISPVQIPPRQRRLDQPLPSRQARSTPASIFRCCPMCLRSEEHTSELQSPDHLVCRLLLEKKKNSNKRLQYLILKTQNTEFNNYIKDYIFCSFFVKIMAFGLVVGIAFFVFYFFF